MKLLALDLAQATGWSVGQEGSILAAGVKSFEPKRGDSLGLRWILYRAWLSGMLDEHAPDAVVWEQAFLGQMRSKYVAEWALGLRTLTQEECDRRGIQYREVHNTQVKLHATGCGNADKAAMQIAACAKWLLYRAHLDLGSDEADARWLCDYGMAGFPKLETQTERQKRERAEARAAKGQEKALKGPVARRPRKRAGVA